MLKINLLPVRQLKKRAKAKQQLFGLVLVLLMFLASIAATGFLQVQKIKRLETEISNLNKKKTSYAPTLKKIDQLKKDREELARKTEIINKLKTDSSLTVRVLDEVAAKVDKQRMWLEALQQQGASLTLSGVALDNQTIAQFMDNIKDSPFVKDVALTNSSQKVVSGRNLRSFALQCAVAQPAPKTVEVADKKK
ncbi:MAG: PilN domain-containing protein [Proteobacteria bacterium]|nr:PilN domain-containing protein [Pseudomonadota bacterium]